MAENDYPPPPPPAPPPQGPPPVWPPPPGGYYAPYPPQTPSVNGTMILVFGILGIVLAFFCSIGGLFGTAAWILANNALATLNATGDPLSERGAVTAGRICGIVGTAIMALMFVFIIGMFAFGMFSSLRRP